MVRKPPRPVSLGIAITLLVATAGWTVLVLTTDALAAMDAAIERPPVALASPAGQIAAAFALITSPVLISASLLVAAFVAFRNRMRNLAGALVLMVLLGEGGGRLMKALIARPRPDQAPDLLSTVGYSYPSGHLAVIVIAAIAVMTILVVTRRPRSTQQAWAVIALLIMIVVGFDRWLLDAHWMSDLIGGALYGASVAAVSLLIAGVSVLPEFPVVAARPQRLTHRGQQPALTPPDPSTERKRCAVIYNPSKIADWISFRRAVEYEVRKRNWRPSLWLETRADDPGREMTQQAIAGGADLVLAAGGDGTVRIVAAGLAGTNIPFAIIPAGTGNLLAKNLSIPLDEAAAIDVAFSGATRQIDLVQVSTDGQEPDHFAVMAGIGVDASILRDTNPDLKKAVGSAAYFVSAAKHANHPPIHVTITVDDGEPFRRRAHVVVLGNVGFLQGGIPLIPDAKPDDGLLDLLVASPRTPSDWARLVTHVLTRRGRVEQLDRYTASKIRIEVAEGDNFELDGDPSGHCHVLEAEVLPGALDIRVPHRRTMAPTAPTATDEAADTSSAMGIA